MNYLELLEITANGFGIFLVKEYFRPLDLKCLNRRIRLIEKFEELGISVDYSSAHAWEMTITINPENMGEMKEWDIFSGEPAPELSYLAKLNNIIGEAML